MLETALNDANRAKDSLATQLEASKKDNGRVQGILSNTLKRESESNMKMQAKFDTSVMVMDRYFPTIGNVTDGPANKRPKIVDQRNLKQ